MITSKVIKVMESISEDDVFKVWGVFFFFKLFITFFSSSICEAQGEQPNMFQVEEQHSLQEVITEETLKSSTCSCYSIPCSIAPCIAYKARGGSAESDSGLSSS